MEPPNTYTSARSDGTAVADETGHLVNNLGYATPSNDGGPRLPKGAMPSSSFASPYDNSTRAGDRLDTPSATPSQRLLDSDLSQAQFAVYPSDEKVQPLSYPPGVQVTPAPHDISDLHTWVPIPLRIWFWGSLVVFMAGGAIALEVALHFSNKNQGWPTSGDFNDTSNVLHYVYTLPPVAVAAVMVAMWTWTDIEIKKMQPYVDLVHGDSPPHRSLLLDYTRTNNFIVWTRAASNKHYLVALASLMVLLSLSFQPLAAALLVVKDTWWTEPDMTVNNLAAIGLNQNIQFSDLTSFLTAAGYASASVLYDLADPPFIHDAYTIAPFELPTESFPNGTVFANTTALKSDPGCQPINIQMLKNGDGSWTNSVNSSGCTFSWSVNKTTDHLFGTDIPNCDSNPPQQFAPIILWFFTYQPQAAASGTICSPSFSLFDVSVTVDLASGNLTQVTEIAPFSSSSNFSQFAGNVTGPPLNGRAYNGIRFNLTNPDIFTLQRQNATQLQLPAAVFQSAVQSPQGLAASFVSDTFVQLSTQVYFTYLNLIAKSVYFLPTTQPIMIQVKTVQKRVWLSDVAVHLLATAMFLLAFFAAFIHILHRRDRRHLRLHHEPGTIASAVSFGAQTGIGNLLAGRQNSKEISDALRNKKFRIDPNTMKIVMEGEEGYEFAHSPDPVHRRRSVFASLQAQSRRLSRVPGTPTTPQTA